MSDFLKGYILTIFLFSTASAESLNDIEINELNPNQRAELIRNEWSRFIISDDQDNFHLRMAENRQKAILNGQDASFEIIESPAGIACARGVKSRRLLIQILATDDELERKRLSAEISANGNRTFENYTSKSTNGWRGGTIVESHNELINIVSDEYEIEADLIKAIMMLETSLRGWPSYYLEVWILNNLFSISSALPMNIKADRWGPLIDVDLDYTDAANNIRLATALLQEISTRTPENQSTVANIASMYNFIGAERTSCYGHLVNWIYVNQLWKFND